MIETLRVLGLDYAIVAAYDAVPGRLAIVAFEKLRGRCVMTTYDPDTLEHDPSVLRRIVQQMGGRLALDSYVVQAGRVSVGDSVKLL